MKTKLTRRFDIILILIASLSAFLNICNIWNNTYANAYYTSAVTSMLQSWHNFFFASFDPAGFVTVDKPPVTFWVQTIFAYIFGVHGWSVILPQALAGIGSVLLMYSLVKPTFGKTAARLAGLVMACTPIAVAVSRTNNIDSMLVFTLLLATWMLFKALRSDKLAWVFGAFALIGVGFNMKMLQAYMVVPAFYLFYLLAYKCEWKKKLAVLAAATVILAGVSLSWAVVVDRIPSDSRPYIGGSKTNSVLELAFGYNGVSRLTGDMRGNGSENSAKQMPNRPPRQNNDGQTFNQPQMPNDEGQMPGGAAAQGVAPGNGVPADGPGGNLPPSGLKPGNDGGKGIAPTGRGMGTGGMFGTGQAGLLRLFQSELSGQISWLLPLAGFACIGLLAGLRRKKALTDKQKETLFWLGWLLPVMAFFSIAGFFHQYYLIMLAPPIAALVGAGWVELYHYYRDREGWKKWLLPAALLSAATFELYILWPYRSQIGAGWSIGIGAASAGLVLVLTFAANKERLVHTAAIGGMLVLLAAPLYWAATPIIYGDNSMMPQAGPTRQKAGAGQGLRTGQKTSTTNDQLLDYLIKNNTGEKYLLATTDAGTAEPYIIKTGRAVMAMGGFNGSDSILTVDKLKQIVKKGEVKYFLIDSGTGFGGRGGSSEVMNWIRQNSTEVPGSKWQLNSAQSGSMGRGESKTLYQINES